MMNLARHPLAQALGTAGVILMEPLAALLLLAREESLVKFRRYRGTEDEEKLKKALEGIWDGWDVRLHAVGAQTLGGMLRTDQLLEYAQVAIALGRLTGDWALEGRGKAVWLVYRDRCLEDGREPQGWGLEA